MKRTDLRRKTWMRRGTTPLARGSCHRGRSPIRKRNPKRVKENHLRAYGGEERIEWFKAQPCLICGAIPSENAHVPSRSGMSRRGDACWIVPLCGGHHRTAKDSLHALNKPGFNAAHGVDLEQLAHVYDARFEAYLASTAPAGAQEK